MKKKLVSISFFIVFCMLIVTLISMNSFKFVEILYGEHTIIRPKDVRGDMLQDAYEHNKKVSEWRIEEYKIDDNGWKLDFPTSYEAIPVCAEIINDKPASEIINIPE